MIHGCVCIVGALLWRVGFMVEKYEVQTLVPVTIEKHVILFFWIASL